MTDTDMHSNTPESTPAPPVESRALDRPTGAVARARAAVAEAEAEVERLRSAAVQAAIAASAADLASMRGLEKIATDAAAAHDAGQRLLAFRQQTLSNAEQALEERVATAPPPDVLDAFLAEWRAAWDELDAAAATIIAGQDKLTRLRSRGVTLLGRRHPEVSAFSSRIALISQVRNRLRLFVDQESKRPKAR